MSVAILDINDSNLQLWNGEKHLQSPGYALLDGSQYSFGNNARAAARVHPRQVNTRFWWQLSTQALQPALGPARHTADLVHAHLLDIHAQGGKPDEILLSVSSSIQRDQLALVLGIIEQCPFKAVGLVNRSVALASQRAEGGKLYHLEIQLHQAVISELAEVSGEMELKRTIPLPGCGLLQLQERLVEIFAAAFIRQTRFDPRRKAETEQLLYNALPGALSELQNASETNLEISGYRARIVRSELETAGNRLFSSAGEATGVLTPADRVLLDPLTDLLPGLRAHIQQSEILANNDLPLALNHHMDRLVQRNKTLNFITCLPVSSRETPAQNNSVSESDSTGDAPQSNPAAAVDVEPVPEPIPEPAPQPIPTHLLTGAIAEPLKAAGMALDPALRPGVELHFDNGHWLVRGDMRSAIKVNGTEYQPGTELNTGDTITTGTGVPAVLITVLP